jgi:HPt (histidine-containing phosphotransfer) domain-containing protein
MLHKMCRSLAARASEYLACIENALRDHDAATLREAAHKFSGVLSAFSTPAGDLAAALEDFAAGSRLDEARALVGRLGTMVRELVRLTDGLMLDDLWREGRSGDERPGGRSEETGIMDPVPSQHDPPR